MFAVQHKQFGTARDVLHIVHDAPVPEVGPNDILVRVWATSINPIDCAIRSGYGLAFWESVGAVKKSHIPGHDVAGEVVKAGRDVTGFKAGDRVWAGVLYGGTAEFAAVAESAASLIPASLSYVEAAGIPFVGLATWSALVDRAGLTESSTAGRRVVITRGAGGVGSFAIQLVKAWGGHVTATCSTRNVAFVRSLGADEVVDYTTQDLAQVLQGFDVAFDMAIDTESALLNSLKTGADAAYVTIVSPKLHLVDQFGLEAGLAKSDALLRSRVEEQAALGRRYYWSFMQPNDRALATIGTLVASGKIRPIIDRVLPITAIVEGHEFSESKQARGKIIIDLAE